MKLDLTTIFVVGHCLGAAALVQKTKAQVAYVSFPGVSEKTQDVVQTHGILGQKPAVVPSIDVPPVRLLLGGTSAAADTSMCSGLGSDKSGMDNTACLQSLSRKVDYSDIKQEVETKVREKCSASVRRRPGKVDLVIPWQFFSGDNALKFELRSFDKFGLLDLVNNVYILVDSRDGVYSSNGTGLQHVKNSKIHILKARDVIDADSWCEVVISKAGANTHTHTHTQPSDYTKHLHTGWCKLAKLHLIPGIAPWVIAVPDDDVLLNEFSMGMLYDDKKHLPYAYSHGSLGCGQCLGGSPTAPLHGPTLLNTCVMSQVGKVLTQKYYAPLVSKSKAFVNNDMMDSVCIATHALQNTGMVAAYYGYSSGPLHFMECHTNGGCHQPPQPREGNFVNIQGDGVSPEYASENALKQRFSRWFENSYPKPSRFETEVLTLMAQCGSQASQLAKNN